MLSQWLCGHRAGEWLLIQEKRLQNRQGLFLRRAAQRLSRGATNGGVRVPCEIGLEKNRQSISQAKQPFRGTGTDLEARVSGQGLEQWAIVLESTLFQVSGCDATNHGSLISDCMRQASHSTGRSEFSQRVRSECTHRQVGIIHCLGENC